MDVARRCGVSKTTVSVVLNDSSTGARVSPATIKRVRQTAMELGYSPSWRARALTNRKTQTIGILYAPPLPLILRANYEGIMNGIHEVLNAHGYQMMLVPLGTDPGTCGEILTDQRLDGCLVFSRLADQLATLLEQSRLPVALVNADKDIALPIVLADDNDGARQITKHLIDLGHRRIAFYVGELPYISKLPPHYSVAERLAGYQATMMQADLGNEIQIVRGSLDQWIQTLASPGNSPTAVILYTHYDAITLLRRLWEIGLKVPTDISVATFNDVYPLAELVPPMTAVALPTEEMGRLAAAMVLEQIETNGAAIPRREVLREKLIIRRSTASPRGHANAEKFEKQNGGTIMR